MIDRRTVLRFASSLAAASGASLPLSSRADPASKLLLVHGRAQGGRAPADIQEEWMATLRSGARAIGKSLSTSVEVAFPYYADVLDRYAQQASIPLTADIQARGEPQNDEFLVFQAQFAEAIRQRAGITDDEVDVEYGANPKPRGPLNWQWVQAILRAIDKRGGGFNQATLEVFTRDVFIYATRAGVRDEIDRIVGAQLTEKPTVVVGHSLGSVVAYNVLRTDRRRLRVPLFVTVGSPLAVRAVRDQFRPLRSPPVDAWFNAFDTRDVVALYPLDDANFPVRPVVDNYDKVRNATENRHGIVGYLNDSEVAGHIVKALKE